MFYPQANFYPQTSFAQLGHPNAMYPNPNAMYPNNVYASGVPQQTPFFTQPFFTQPFFTQLPFSNWQQPTQQPTRQLGINAFNGVANGAVQPGIGPWAQPQAGPEQINPAFQQFNPAQQQVPYGHLLQQLAQYHNLIAQQLAQLAAQTALVSGGTYPFAGQFIPGQLSPNFGSGITMH
jgi:hypothetical protein